MGTIVVGVPFKAAPKRRKRKDTLGGQAKLTKGMQPSRPKTVKAAAVNGCQHQQEQPGASLNTQQGPSAAAPAAAKPRGRSHRKRKVVVVESPPRLPPISPGALSLQAGVKRRRLAKLLQEQAAVGAASSSPHADQATSQAATEAAGDVSSEGEVGELCTQQAAENNTQAQLQHEAQPAASQTASAAAAQGANQAGGEDGQVDRGAVQCPVSEAGPGSAPDSPNSAECEADEHKADGEQTTLSFDVGAMELFQQQDTCDAFGSFWRRTSGVGTAGSQGAGQVHDQAAPSAFGGWYTAFAACSTDLTMLP